MYQQKTKPIDDLLVKHLHFVCFYVSQPSDSGSVRKLLVDSKTLRRILDEADSLLRMFWRAALPNSEETKQVRTSRDPKETVHIGSLEKNQKAESDTMENVKDPRVKPGVCNIKH